MQIDKVYRSKIKILEALRKYFREEVDDKIEIILFNQANNPNTKYKDFSMEDKVKKMTVDEMVLAEDIPPELFIQKLKEVKVTYLGPTTNLASTDHENKEHNLDDMESPIKAAILGGISS